MPTLVEKMKQAGIQPVNKTSVQTGGTLVDKMKALGIQPSDAPQTEQKGFLRQLAEGIIRPAAEVGVSAYNAGKSALDLVTGYQAQAPQDVSASRNLPFLGETKPAFTGKENTGEAAKKMIGYGAEIGSNLIGGEGLVGIGENTVKGLFKQGLKEGIKTGVFAGAAQQGGQALEQGKGIGDVLKSTAEGGLYGGVGGGILGGVGGALGGTVKAIAPIAKKTGLLLRDTAESTGKFLGGVPENTLTNLEDRIAQNTAIKQLPKSAQEAVSAGILPRDAALFTSGTDTEKSILSKMTQDAIKYSENRGNSDPAIHVGQEFRDRITKLEDLKQNIGQKLGNYVKGMSREQIPNVETTVLTKMEEVPGLKGLNIDELGKLDFINTTLSGSQTAGDRAAIQKAFDDIIGRDPYQLHRYRQELFEILGGKKKSLANITDTQEKAFNAIRQGISDSLDSANPRYAALNKQYAQILSPLQEIGKYFKNANGMTEDLLNMKAAMLARRLTSNAMSNPEIRNIINMMEDVLAKNGIKFNSKIDTVQEFYNALSRYLDITKDTSLAGQVKQGLEGPGSIKESVVQAVRGVAGKTDATRKKALEKMLVNSKNGVLELK